LARRRCPGEHEVVFIRDYPEGFTKDRANIALKEVEAAAGETEHGDKLRQLIARIRRIFKLTS
jgi:hypothetical protein